MTANLAYPTDLTRNGRARRGVLRTQRRRCLAPPPPLEVRGLTMTRRGRGKPMLRDVGFDARRRDRGHRGRGNGQFELVQSITGIATPDQAQSMSGRDVTGAL